MSTSNNNSNNNNNVQTSNLDYQNTLNNLSFTSQLDNPSLETSKEERLQDLQADNQELKQLLELLQTHKSIVPDHVSNQLFEQAGLETNDPKVKQVLSLAAEKFIVDLLTDAYQYNRVRNSQQKDKKKKAACLSTEDLMFALREHGVNVFKPEFFM